MSGATGSVITVMVFVLIFICALAIYFVARLRFKAQNVGSFNVAYRRRPEDVWVAGVCHYSEDLLKWYRIISLKWGSTLRWTRHGFEILDAQVQEADGVRLAILHCRAQEAKRGVFLPPADFWLAMGEPDYSGLVSWMESAPPQSIEIY
ncbi:MAG: DUF2550 domain-containing protein [Mobiluncus porci]|uniref:DUF2550 domain-containing protein n=1 Tax=Mobiluncus TaxID=2050 RepID=UPI0023F3C5B5|nr:MULTISPECIES: DUF2550 domain-containing protein [Mobiluncus]MCI6584104.1 DUF2550 domain-containing protein [Mobiluncus sp.]MDD7541949.1 DUF2550 domain-containing protein [Mobiluncus porci]MDY5748882.1 DUF2550 domain-containing protein [Mobiluncus porci]